MWLNSHVDFINFAISEMEKIGTISSIKVTGEGGYLDNICFEVEFFRMGTFKDKVTISYVSGNYQTNEKEYTEEEIRQSFIEKLNKFVNRDNTIRELKDRKNNLNEELKNIEKQLKEYNIE